MGLGFVWIIASKAFADTFTMPLVVCNLCSTFLGFQPVQEPVLDYKVSGSWLVRVCFIGSALFAQALVDIDRFPITFWLLRDLKLD